MKKIPLTQGKFALVDDADYDKVRAFRWCASLESRGTKYYAIRWVKIDGKRTKIRMHCFLMGRPPRPTDGLVVHHKDDDSLNNQRESNLEIVTQMVNMKLAPGWKKKAVEPFL